MDHRQSHAGAPETVYVPAPRPPALQLVDSPSRTDGHSSHAFDRQSPSAAAGSPHAVKPNYLSKTSLLYLLCVGNIIIAVFYLAVYDQACISRAHYDELKANLRPPWMLYRWLGSKGVDVTDLQWYVFVVALPPAAPYLVVFLYISRRLRRYIASQPATAAAVVRGHGGSTSIHDCAPGGSSAAVKGGSDAPLTPFGSNSSAEPSPPVVVVEEISLASSTPSTLLVRRNTAPLHVFHIVSGAFIALCLSGPGFLFGAALVSLNFFCIAPLYKKLSFRACMAIMWVSHIAILFLNFHAGGYKFAWFGLSFLDNLWTPLIRWNTQYNMAILRMISFNNDLWESALVGEDRREKSLQKHERTCIACAQIRDQNKHAAATLPQEAVSCYKCRTECPRAVPEYTFSAYLGYMYYLPLYMAGPLSSFNAYVSYMHYPQRSMVGSATWRYGLRWLGHAFMLSTLMHYVYIMAMLLTPTAPAGGADPLTTTTATVTKAIEALMEAVTGLPSTTTTTLAPGPPVLDSMTFSQKSVLFFLVLAFLWAKFDVIWRFFRFFALLDGFDPPEDMPRCFANTVNIQSFWRDWHASFNLWLVRYMYIPMGGSRTKFLSIFPIFFFIAIWHDIEMRLLFWALFICIGFVPEIVVTTFFASKTNKLVLRIKRHRLLWRSLRICGTQLCLMELTLANLVGFAIGTSGTGAGLRQLFNEMTTGYLIYTPLLFFSAATLATQERDQKTYETAQLKIKYGLQ
ncbi:hypothetical protein ABB37_02665 [Leptomonas pyrrhocoris]|uniref:Glycerol uptake protein n=1 Tax=Leptomonas pyrrhocoris TaxID=157538 RepID=A0A0N0DXF9_LEPPY|nr:hypothetical protein ABB37_02665 [Leptomonas pyrrhocoris]KPA82911.1 hypothetical protein ABB37_02665 [Leptomonas pyrrhocoris]|eukprot:XP_015661350.1 hypothetical protein ABB37_02665 [Leptomonas pyrrhocoris]